MIKVKIVADSINTIGKRITTMQLCYPRFIHADFNKMNSSGLK